MTHFQHHIPIDPSRMTRWRKRLGAAGAEQMLRAAIGAGMAMRVIRPAQLKRINVDTTVQTKAIRFPTDARLYQRMRERLVKAARAEGLAIKQSYEHVGRRLLMQSSRYAHARQIKRARAGTRKLKTPLGRVIREVERQTEDPFAAAMNFQKLPGAFWRIFLCCLMRVWDSIRALQVTGTLQTSLACA
jgi:IS5 family transposase